MKIPCCRATVSEEICSWSLGEVLGRPVVAVEFSELLLAKPGDRREPSTQPFSRVKGEVHAVRLSFCFSHSAAGVRLGS